MIQMASLIPHPPNIMDRHLRLENLRSVRPVDLQIRPSMLAIGGKILLPHFQESL